MISSALQDFIGGELAQRAGGVRPPVDRPTVDRPSVSAPTPFDDDERMDISDRFRPQRDLTSPDSFYGTAATGGSDSQGFYTGPINVTGMSQSVADQFVSAGKDLRGALSPTGLGTFIGLGAAASKMNLERIEKKIAAGEEGYGLAMFNGRIVGVSPGIFGDDSFVFSGVLPEGLTHKQRVELRDAIMTTRTPATSDAGLEATMPPPEPSDEERAASGRANIVYDGDGNPVTVGSGRDFGNYVTTDSGKYVSQAELEKQNAAKQAADEAAAAAARREQSSDDSSSSAGSGRTESAGADWSAPSTSSDYEREAYGDYGQYRARGGRVGMADGGSADPVQSTGFVEGSPDNYTKAQTVADDENRQVREGSFVLNAPTTEKLQKAGLLPKRVDNPDKKSTIKANKGGLMDVALSKGEYVIEPEEAQRIGYSFLEQLNNQGKAEVDRRQAAADGGFLGGYNSGGKLPTTLPEPSPVRQAYVGEDIDRPEIPLTDNMIAQFKVYNSSKKQREDVENLINALNDRENLALVALAETTAENDDIEAMMGVQTTVLNRVKSKGVKLPKYPTVRRDFTEATDVKSALKQRTPGRGSGSFMFQYDGFEPKFLSPKIDSILKGQVPKFAITKLMASSANVLDPEAQFGGGLLPDTVTFYTREDAPLAKDMELNPQMRYVTTIGGHDFYSYEAAPESPDEEKIYKEYLDKKRKKKN